MNKSIKSAQGGFTLIELIVVIVILGILAATALPKFTNLSGDARLASLNAARGALSASSAMIHGKFLVSPGSTVDVEGTAVDMSTATGYPVITSDDNRKKMLAAAGLAETDYVVFAEGAEATTGSPRPKVDAGNIAIAPKSLEKSANVAKCFVTYAPASANATTGIVTAPVITLTGTADSCQ
ncbi:type II secretion system protein [Telluria sp. B2]